MMREAPKKNKRWSTIMIILESSEGGCLREIETRFAPPPSCATALLFSWRIPLQITLSVPLNWIYSAWDTLSNYQSFYWQKQVFLSISRFCGKIFLKTLKIFWSRLKNICWEILRIAKLIKYAFNDI